MQHCHIPSDWLTGGLSFIFLNVADFKDIRTGQGFGKGSRETGARPTSESSRRVKSVQMLVGFKTLVRIGCIGEGFDRHRA